MTQRRSSTVDPDSSLARPTPHHWDLIEVGQDDRTLRIEYLRGVHDGLHRVDVRTTDDAVRVTIYLGLLPWFLESAAESDVFVSAVGVVEATTLILDEPVSGRTIVDPVPRNRGLDPPRVLYVAG